MQCNLLKNILANIRSECSRLNFTRSYALIFMNIQLLLGTFWHGLDFQKPPYSMNSFYLKHKVVISPGSSVMRNSLTGPVILGDVTQSVIISLSVSDNWIFCLFCKLLGSCAFLSSPKFREQQMFAFTSLVWKLVSGCYQLRVACAPLLRGNILEVSSWTHEHTPAWRNWAPVDFSLHWALGSFLWWMQTCNS